MRNQLRIYAKFISISGEGCLLSQNSFYCDIVCSWRKEDVQVAAGLRQR